jgi:hypothetical protein
MEARLDLLDVEEKEHAVSLIQKLTLAEASLFRSSLEEVIRDRPGFLEVAPFEAAGKLRSTNLIIKRERLSCNKTSRAAYRSGYY